MTSKTYRKQVGIAKWSLGIVLVFGLLTAPAVRAQCEQAKLTASDASADDLLGRAVSIDGDLLVVGARTADTSELASGAAYVFRNTQNGWIEEQKLAANDPQSFAAFGTSVSISDDIIVVGARRADQANIDSGAAYVFRHNGTSWIQEAKLVPDTGADLDQFGSSVGIAGNYVVLGAPGHDSEASDAGAAYIFWYNGSMWVQQTKLVASNPGLSDGFGWRVALGGDLAVVTSPLKQAAYVFRRQGSSWPQESILTPNEATTADDWIEGVSVDGDMVVLGYIRVQPKPTAARVSSVLTGAAYVFHHDGISWSQVAKLTPSTATDFAYFGISVGLSKNRIVVGAEQDDVPGSNRGSAFVFKRSGSIWNEEAKIVASDGMTDDLFGQSTAIDDTFLVVGAPNNDHACPQDLFCNSGAAYVYWLKSSPACEEIPAVSLWSMVALCLLLLCGATIGIRNRVVPRNVSCPLIGVLAMSIVSSPIYAQLHQRTPLPKVDSLTRPEEPNRLEIKFRDDLKVRASDGNITSLTGSDISDVLAVRTDHALTFEQLIILPQTDIDTLEAEAAKISGFAQPDLAGMMIVRGGDGIIEIAGNELLALDQLEWAQFVILQSGDPSDCAASTGPFCVWEEPESFCPADTKTFPCDACDVAAPTCDYFADRGSSGIKDYHAPDPGINMAYAWATNTASRGACVRIADIENAFRRGHEDLCVILEPDNQPLFPVNSLDHGTAVLGEIVAADNGYGWTGLAPEATAWFFSKAEIGTLTAMVRAQLETEPGDIVLLEVGHPAELDDAIWTTTCTLVQSGRIVVTPAGNSAFGLDLDSSQFENYRSRVCGGIPSGDSGAIIVGAGTADLAHTRNPQSGYGARVNLQGWGDDVTTLGGGDLDKAGVGDEAYTNTFSNTSAATPFVAAAAVALQGIAQDEFGGARLTAMQIRKLLGDTGTSEGTPIDEHIGSLPNMADAIDHSTKGLRQAGLKDCNTNSVSDLLDIWAGTSQDCNFNLVPDDCDLASGASQDCVDILGTGIPDECEAILVPPNVPDETTEPGFRNNRYISVKPGNPGQTTALHVSLTRSGTFPSAAESYWYVGAPQSICENSALKFATGWCNGGTCSAASPSFGAGCVQDGDCCPSDPGAGPRWFWGAKISAPGMPGACNPAFVEWSGSCSSGTCIGGLNNNITCMTDDDCEPIVRIYGQPVVPNTAYTMRSISQSACVGKLSSAVMGLGVHTTAAWGDVTRNFACPHGSPDGTVDLIPDVISVSDKFSNVNCPVTKGRADLEPAVPDLLNNISDVLACLNAFSGVPYPFAMAASCP